MADWIDYRLETFSKQSAERVRDELLDVAAVAMRLFFGEVDTAIVLEGLVQLRGKALLPPDPEREAQRSLDRITELRRAAAKSGGGT